MCICESDCIIGHSHPANDSQFQSVVIDLTNGRGTDVFLMEVKPDEKLTS